MNHSSKSLISILILSLFTLTVLQGFSILKRQSNVLGENTSVGSTNTNYFQRCAAIGGTCAENCSTATKPVPGTDCAKLQCCVPFSPPQLKPTSYPTYPTPTSYLSTKNIPCGEIERIQKLYCTSNIGTSPTPTSYNPVCINGDRRCSGNTIQICMNYLWSSGEYCNTGCYQGKCVNTVTKVTPTSSPIRK